MDVATVDHSTRLEAPAEAVWAAVKTPAAFRRVMCHVFSMPVIRGRVEPWREGETVTGWVFLFGFIPFSRHQLHVASIDDAARTLTGRERGGLRRRPVQESSSSAAMVPSITRPATFSLEREPSMTNDTARAMKAPPQAAPRTSAASRLAISTTAMPIPMKSPPYVARTSDVPSRPGIPSPIVRLTCDGHMSPSNPATIEMTAPT